MDRYENNGWNPDETTGQNAPQQESAASYTPQNEPHSYRGAGTGRKESPYANSPYVMHHAPRQESCPPYEPYCQEPQHEAPRKPKAPKAPKKKGGYNVISGSLDCF